MKKKFSRTLCLNANYIPFCVISAKKAFVKAIIAEDIYEIGVTIVENYDHPDAYLTSAYGKLEIPSIVRLNQFRHKKRKGVPFKKNNIFLRDKSSCQYCGEKIDPSNLTIDHVIPRREWKIKNMAGTPTNWENVVACCRRCNVKKGHRLLKDIPDMRLLNVPIKPGAEKYIPGITIGTRIPKQWVPYLEIVYKDLSLFKIEDF